MPSKRPQRLDVHLGALRVQVERDAALASTSPGEVLRQAYTDWRLRQLWMADDVRQAVLAVAAAVEPDERVDPADDTRLDAPLAALAQTLHSPYAALGIADALRELADARLSGGDAVG